MKINTRRALAGAAVAGLLAFAGQAEAVVYTATYKGTVSGLSESGTAVGLFNGASAGVAFTAVYRWDDADNDPLFDEYYGPMTATLAFGSFSFEFESYSGTIYQFDRYFVRHHLDQYDLVDADGSLELSVIGDDFLASGGWRAAGTYDLTGQQPFGEANFAYMVPIGGNNYIQAGHAIANLAPTSLVVAREGEGGPVSAAPEPGAWTLMILGFGAAGSMLRISRRRGALASSSRLTAPGS